LAQALKSGKVSAAGLDVLSVEPPGEDNPLIGLSNCIVTPHIAWITRESRIRLIDTAVSNLESWLTGETVNCVNRVWM
jgi:glycerate dehydrogenase